MLNLNINEGRTWVSDFEFCHNFFNIICPYENNDFYYQFEIEEQNCYIFMKTNTFYEIFDIRNEERYLFFNDDDVLSFVYANFKNETIIVEKEFKEEINRKSAKNLLSKNRKNLNYMTTYCVIKDRQYAIVKEDNTYTIKKYRTTIEDGWFDVVDCYIKHFDKVLTILLRIYNE